MTRALRAVALLIAVAGVIDPAIAVDRTHPVRVEFRAGPSPWTRSVRDRLIRDLGASIAAADGEPPDAVVLVDSRDSLTVPDAASVSIVARVPPGARNVRLIRAVSPGTVLVGQEAVFSAEFEAIGMAGQSSAIALEQHAVPLAATEHRWTSPRERFTASLPYVPPMAGISRMTLRARPLAGEATDEDNAADVPLVASARTLRVAVYEPRPSWAAGFVRRALESDPVFVTSSLVRPSRGPVVTAGPRLRSLSSDVLASYDAILIGAPEDLSGAEVAALTTFCEVRGGAVVFLPDRRPSGPYAQVVSLSGFEELLIEKPVALTGEGPVGVSASEFSVPRGLGPGADVVASLSQPSARPVIVSLPRGRGRVVFSGALDAWRFRAAGADEAAFARFWTGIVANLASSSPARVSISVNPAVAAPGDRLIVRVTVDSFAARGEGPGVSASLVAADGSEQFVRLWPLAEAGVFEGEAVASWAGEYDARATAGGDTADTPMIVADDVRHPPAYDEDDWRVIAAATGGVVVDATDLAPLQRHLRGLARREAPRTIHPMRSGWWVVPFAGALCLEWAVRRRRGAR